MNFKNIFRRNKNREKEMEIKKLKEAAALEARGTMSTAADTGAAAGPPDESAGIVLPKLGRAELRKVDKISKTLLKNEPTPGVNLRTLDYYCGTQLTLLNLGKSDRTGTLKGRAWNELSRDLKGSIHGFLAGMLALPGEYGDGKDPEAIMRFYWQSANFIKLWAVFNKSESDFREVMQSVGSSMGKVR